MEPDPRCHLMFDSFDALLIVALIYFTDVPNESRAVAVSGVQGKSTYHYSMERFPNGYLKFNPTSIQQSHTSTIPTWIALALFAHQSKERRCLNWAVPADESHPWRSWSRVFYLLPYTRLAGWLNTRTPGRLKRLDRHLVILVSGRLTFFRIRGWRWRPLTFPIDALGSYEWVLTTHYQLERFPLSSSLFNQRYHVVTQAKTQSGSFPPRVCVPSLIF